MNMKRNNNGKSKSSFAIAPVKIQIPCSERKTENKEERDISLNHGASSLDLGGGLIRVLAKVLNEERGKAHNL